MIPWFAFPPIAAKWAQLKLNNTTAIYFYLIVPPTLQKGLKTGLRTIESSNCGLMKIPGNRPIGFYLAYSKASAFRNKGTHTSNLWGKYPLYGCNATGRLISWEWTKGCAWESQKSKRRHVSFISNSTSLLHMI